MDFTQCPLFQLKSKKQLMILLGLDRNFLKQDYVASQVSAYIKKDGKVILNSRFLLDALNSTEEKNIEFCFSGNLSPVVIRGENNDKYVHIIMPLKS